MKITKRLLRAIIRESILSESKGSGSPLPPPEEWLASAQERDYGVVYVNLGYSPDSPYADGIKISRLQSDTGERRVDLTDSRDVDNTMSDLKSFGHIRYFANPTGHGTDDAQPGQAFTQKNKSFRPLRFPFLDLTPDDIDMQALQATGERDLNASDLVKLKLITSGKANELKSRYESLEYEVGYLEDTVSPMAPGADRQPAPPVPDSTWVMSREEARDWIKTLSTML